MECKSKIRTAALALAMLAGVGALDGQVPVGQPALYGVTFWNQNFIVIDPDTAGATLITNLAIRPYDLTENGETLFLYSAVSGADRLSAIHARTGQILNHFNFTNVVAGAEGGLDFLSFNLAFASRSDGATGSLVRLDLELPESKLVSAEGGLNPSLDGLAFDRDATLYGLSQNRGGAFSLYTLNLTSGGMTLVGELGINFAFNGGAVAGLAFSPEGVLFAALGSPVESVLYRLDKTTGRATRVGQINYPGVCGIRFFTYLPPPGPLSIYPDPQGIRVAWPVESGGFLQRASFVAGPWSDSQLTVSTNGAEAVIVAPLDGGQGFFRLWR